MCNLLIKPFLLLSRQRYDNMQFFTEVSMLKNVCYICSLMFNKGTYQPSFSTPYRFKAWSRKGYAAFNSLNMVVHIGNLSVSLAQWIGQVVEHTEEILILCTRNEMEEQVDVNEPGENPALLVLTNTLSIVYPKSKYINCTNCR